MTRKAKRGLDVLLSVAGLCLLSPVFLLLALWIRLDSPGGVIFRQRRVGRGGIPFTMYKFRSMTAGSQTHGTGLCSFENDPRVTRCGKYLRAYALDELPQLLNVLKGDMSLVGPRPAAVGELGAYETLSKRYKKRFAVRPGMTGLAQIRGRNNLTWDEKIAYDLTYIQALATQGLKLDVQILLHTIPSLLRREGVYEDKERTDADDLLAAQAITGRVIAGAQREEGV